VLLSEIAREAGISRQALYLHFADRADLFTAVARYADERRGLPEAIRKIEEASTGVEAMGALVDLQARLNPQIWPFARALDDIRRQDEAAERSWQDRLQNRLEGCRGIIGRMAREETLRAGLTKSAAADLLWTLTSLRTWEDLVLLRGWSAERYRRHVRGLVHRVLTNET